METKYDCAIIGGGLAGLCLSIQLADAGVSVVLFEKNKYPFHKVCGEYISMESWDFLESLGLPLNKMSLPKIDELGISSERGYLLRHKLGLGGFGVSRFTLDHQLSLLAAQRGVTVLTECRVNDVIQEPHGFLMKSSLGTFEATVVCGSYGKYTPQFVGAGSQAHSAGKYIGVKYHLRADLPVNRIELHNFHDGYCGISKVDLDCYCLCYLTTARNLVENGNDIRRMERHILYKNPFLRQYFENAEFVNAKPLVISNIQFSKKYTRHKGILMLGDAAGSITPLCGNGMSMGMRASKLLATELFRFFAKKQSLETAGQQYDKSWNAAFATRIRAGYYLQNLFGKNLTTDLALRFLKTQPALLSRLVGLTHGERF